MHSASRILTILFLFYSTAISGGAESNKAKVLFTPSDIWIPIFNCLSLEDQYHLSLACKSLCATFNNQLVCAQSRYTGNFDTKRGFINRVKNLFIPQRTAEANRYCETFCKKIATNKLGGSIDFRCSTVLQFNLFCESLKTNTCITQLTIRDCLINCHAEIVADSVRHNRSLKSLRLPDNLITYEYVCYILTTLPQLEELDVSRCPLPVFYSQDKMAWAALNENLKILIPAMCNLKKLHMNKCLLYEDQIDWMVDFLKTNTKLEELYLAGNQINDGILGPKVELIQAADNEGNPLKVLDLRNNSIYESMYYVIKRKDLKVIL